MESKLPFTLKDTVTIVATIAILIALYKISQALGFVKTADERKEAKELKETEKLEKKDQEKEETKLKDIGYKLTYPKSVYRRKMDEIVNLFGGITFVTTDKEVFDIVLDVVRNPLDWNEMNQVFGASREVDSDFVGTTTYNSFSTMLKGEMDKTLFPILKTGLAKRGVTL